VEPSDPPFRRRIPRNCYACRDSLVRYCPGWADVHSYRDVGCDAHRHSGTDLDVDANADSDGHSNWNADPTANHADADSDRNVNSAFTHADFHGNPNTFIYSDCDGITDIDAEHERQNRSDLGREQYRHNRP